MIKSVFWNVAERRIRSFWRLTITGFCAFASCFIAALVVQLLFPRLLIALSVGAPLTLLCVFLAVVLGGRFLDRRDWRGFGLRLRRWWLADLVFGLALGMVLVTGVLTLQSLAGWVRRAEQPQAYADESRMLEFVAIVVFFVCVGIYEEVAFRGYLFKNLAEGWNWRSVGPKMAVFAAACATSLLFGILHGLNPNATLISVGNTVLSGFLFSLALLLTGELAIPIGYHITWNMTQSVVYGLPVSGVALGGGLFSVESTGPTWMTGGSYGIEGGMLCTLALLTGMLLTIVWVRRSERPLQVDVRLAEAPM